MTTKNNSNQYKIGPHIDLTASAKEADFRVKKLSFSLTQDQAKQSNMSKERTQIQEQLRELVESQGEELCFDQRKAMALLLNKQPQRPAEIVALHAAVREGVAADLSQQIGVELSALAIERFARRMPVTS